MIVKVQKPLFSSERDAPALVYDRKRTHKAFMPLRKLPRPVRDALRTRDKVFAEAACKGAVLIVGKIVEDQSW